MPSSILYVSRSSLSPDEESEQLAAIRLVSQRRNAALDVTGVLVATPCYFAQFLEGEAASLDSLMGRIRADRRHSDIFIADTLPFGFTVFPGWRMACFPSGSFTSRHVQPLLEHRHGVISPIEASRLVQFLRRIVPDEAPLWTHPTVQVEIGDVVDEVVNVALEMSADLIVLGVNSDVSFWPIRGDDTVYNIIASARCPVLSIRHNPIRA